MNPVFTLGATVLIAALVPLALLAMHADAGDGLVALELAGVLTTVALVCLAVGLNSTSFTGIAVITAVMTWLGGLVFARFLDREP